MAFNSNIKGYMTFGKSFSRGGAFPLEAYEIWTDYDALVAYAANTNPDKDPSYIGQKVAYVDLENNKVTHYGIEIDGTLKELGATPIGDEKSIVVDENDYTISLKGVDGLVFEKDVLGEDGEPTGEKEEVKYQPLMTKDGLVWVEPSKTTVEGLATLLSELTARVKALEDDRVTEQELADAIAGVEAKIDAVDFVDNDELAAAIKVETDRAEAAEKALGERIDAIDFVDADELAGALEEYAKTADVNKTLEDYAKTADVNKTLEEYAKTADVNTELDKKAKQSDLEALQNRVDAFLTGEGTEAALDSLQELIAYIESHDDVDIAGILEDIQGIEDKLVGIDGTVAEYVTAAINALSIGDYAKAADLTALAERVAALEAKPFDSYATKAELEAHAEAAAAAYATKAELTAHEEAAAAAYATKAELTAHAEAAEAAYAKKTDVVANDVFEQFKTDNTQAITDAVAGHETAVAQTYATKAELAAHEEAAANAYAKKTDVYTTEEVDELIANINEGNQETAGEVSNRLEAYKTSNDKEIANLKAKDTEHSNGITTLNEQLANTNTNVSNNTTEIGKINTEITTGLKPRLEALEGADEVIEAAVTEHTAALKTLNETTVPALQGAIDGEAKARDDADKAILTKIGDVATGKTVVDMINEVAGTIDFSPYAKKDEVANTYATKEELANEADRADKAEKANAQAIADLTNGAVKKNTDDIAAINALLNTVDSEDTITSLKELAIWVEDHESEVLPVIEDQGERLAAAEAILAGIGGEGEKTTVKAYVDDAIAAIPAYDLPAATADKLGGIKSAVDVDGKVVANAVYVDATTNVASVKAVSTDVLVQGLEELVLNGGNAGIQA